MRQFMNTKTNIRLALYCVGAMAFFGVPTKSLAARIAAWDFTGEDTVATSAAEIYNSNLDSSNLLTRGAGATASAGANSFRTAGFQNDGISTSNTDYFQFTLSAASGYALSLSTIDGRVKGTLPFRPLVFSLPTASMEPLLR